MEELRNEEEVVVEDLAPVEVEYKTVEPEIVEEEKSSTLENCIVIGGLVAGGVGLCKAWQWGKAKWKEYQKDKEDFKKYKTSMADINDSEDSDDIFED